ncbi:MAG: hypothetical protein AMS25_15175 [Gemmatimonas sp. SM23_52]|nr:MAG: hypothetical protein AMS25_15175 [Gemmatimonas sp. SM23_52]
MRVGAGAGWLTRARSVGVAVALVLEATAWSAAVLAAQEPDTTAVERPGAEAQVPDTAAAPDTLVVPVFPEFPRMATRDPWLAAGWELRDILATGALTLADLLEHTSPLDPIRLGFLEGPQLALFAGAGAGGLRYDVDGFEIAPLAGGPLDLHLLSLVEQQRLTLVREPGGYQLSSQAYRNQRREPYSRVEAGTGYRNANVLRGLFSSGLAGGVMGFGLDRIDTDGVPELGSSQRTVLWANYARELPWGIWGQVEYRGTSSERDSFPEPKRSDWIVRLRRPLGDGWHADLVAGSSTLEQPPALPIPDVPVDSAQKFTARQLALRGARTAEHWRAQLTLRAWDGDGVPKYQPEAALELRAGPASVYASARYSHWGDYGGAAGYGAVNLDLPLGLRWFAEVEDGERDLFGGVPVARQFFTRWTAGAEAKLWKWRVGARGGRWRVDPSPALGLPADSAESLRGGTVSVVDAWAGGQILEIFGGQLEAGGRVFFRERGPFLYWPLQSWQAEGRWYLQGKGGQLEIWLTGMGGVRGPLLVPDESLGPGAAVPTGDLYWFRAEAAVRVLDVHIYYNYEIFNATEVRGDLPGFPLPLVRDHFGVKWEFWN